MLIGPYSIPQLINQYKTPNGRKMLQGNVTWLTFGFILWFTALGMLLFYWDKLEVWAKLLGLLGLFFNAGGQLFTIVVVSLSTMDQH
jgi:hypothetical protein